MAYTDHPAHHRTPLRSALDRLKLSAAALAAALDDLDEALQQRDAQVLTLDFGTTATTSETQPAERKLPSKDEFPRIRSRWSQEEDDQLRFALGLGLGHNWIAERLGRTQQACQDRACTLRKEGRL